MQRKVFFWGVGGTKSPESGTIFEYLSIKISNFCGFVRSNIFFFDQNIIQFVFEKKNIYRFHTFFFGGGGLDQKCESFFFWEGP